MNKGIIICMTQEQLQSMLDKAITTALSLAKQEVPKMLTRKEASEMLHVTLPTLSAWEKSGKLSPVRMGKRVLYPLTEVKSIMNQ